MEQRWLGGWHVVMQRLEQAPASVERVLLLAGRDDRRARRVRELCQAGSVVLGEASRDELDRRLGGDFHDGVAALCRLRGGVQDESQLQHALDRVAAGELMPVDGPGERVLVLDGVTDPRNFGACIRAADGSGVGLVVAPRQRAAGLTPVALKTASGALDAVRICFVTNLARSLRQFAAAGYRIVGTSDDAPLCLFDADLSGPLVFVMGGEERGMRRLTREACDELVHLPMEGAVSSLNVAVATGVCLYEVLRQTRAAAAAD